MVENGHFYSFMKGLHSDVYTVESYAIFDGVALRCVHGRDLSHVRPFMKGLHSDVYLVQIWPMYGHYWKGCTPMCTRSRLKPFEGLHSDVYLVQI